MSNKFRKVLAAVLAATMVLGSGVVANAADPEGAGEGKGEVHVVKNPEVFDVVLPTSSGTTFNYILDPTGVIEKTKYEAFGGATAATFDGTGNMWFENKKATESDPRKFTNESDPINAYNKSNISVDIEVVAHLATPSGITIATQSVIRDTTASPSMYLAMKATENNASKEYPIKVAGTTATASIATASEDAYETRYVNKEYVNQLKATAAELKESDADFGTLFQKYSFTLTGDCNPDGEWKDLTTDPPVVNLVWTIQKPEGAVEGITYTEKTANGNWSSGKLWLSKDGSAGFSTTGLTVEVSDGGTTFETLATNKYTIHDSGWISTTWDDLVAGIGSTPTGKVHVRVTDGTTRYTWINNK